MQNKTGSLFWQIYANVYDLVRFLPPYQNLLRDAKKALEIRSGDRVLDAGCGTGNFIEFLSKDINIDFTGIDISDIMLSKAKEKTKRFQNIHLLLGNLNEKLPFNDTEFDRIVAINSLYAVSNPSFTLSELMRVLKSGGILTIINPHSEASFAATYFQIINSGKGLQKVFLFFVTLPLFFFNAIIKIKANKQNFHFLSQSDWQNLIINFDTKEVKITQSFLHSYLLRIIKS